VRLIAVENAADANRIKRWLELQTASTARSG
jgi:hypothetical protein